MYALLHSIGYIITALFGIFAIFLIVQLVRLLIWGIRAIIKMSEKTEAKFDDYSYFKRGAGTYENRTSESGSQDAAKKNPNNKSYESGRQFGGRPGWQEDVYRKFGYRPDQHSSTRNNSQKTSENSTKKSRYTESGNTKQDYSSTTSHSFADQGTINIPYKITPEATIRAMFSTAQTRAELDMRHKLLRKMYHPDNYHGDGSEFVLENSIYKELCRKFAS